MRKLILQMQMTLDGFVAGPEGQLDWMTPGMDEKQLAILTELTEGMDTILMGRKMTAGFTAYWESVVENQPDSPEYAYAKIFVDTPKIVFSKTAEDIDGRNVTLEKGDVAEVVHTLKQQQGKNLIVYGGAGFVGELVSQNLIDELYLFVHPITLGQGLRVFNGRHKYQLVKSTVCENGVVINQYGAGG